MTMLSGAERAHHRQPREPHAWYTEPHWCDWQLFATLLYKGAIHDGCCGEGRIPMAAIAAGYKATGSDLIYRGFGTGGVDFLKDYTRHRNLVFNPPSNIKRGIYIDHFVLHALEVATETVTVIVPVPYLGGQDRFWELYKTCPPSLVLLCSQGLRCLQEGWASWSRAAPSITSGFTGIAANRAGDAPAEWKPMAGGTVTRRQH